MTHTSRQAFKLSVDVMGQGLRSVALLAASLCVWGSLKVLRTKHMSPCSIFFSYNQNTLPRFNPRLYKKTKDVAAPKDEAKIKFFLVALNMEVYFICVMKSREREEYAKKSKTSVGISCQNMI